MIWALTTFHFLQKLRHKNKSMLIGAEKVDIACK